MRRLLPFLLVLLAADPAGAAGTSSQSTNWAGYAVQRAGVRFARVSGAWTVPSVSCQDGADRWSAVWVGIGGYATDAPALEQIGTEADCDSAGRPRYGSWYELVPDVSRDLRLALHPGDRVAASVTILGRRVRLRLADRTTGRSATRVLAASVLDQTSAEWIVEAPSACRGAEGADCTVMPLADFGTTRIAEARALSTAGHAGGVGDAAWDWTRIDLVAYGLGAQTGGLDAAGRTFTIATTRIGRGPGSARARTALVTG